MIYLFYKGYWKLLEKNKKLEEEVKKTKEEKRKEIQKQDEEIKKMKEEKKKEINDRDEEIKKMKQEIIFLQQELKKSKIENDNEKSYNILFTLYFFFCFSVLGLEIVNHPHPERFSLCGNILSFKAKRNLTTIYLKPTITSVC
jgi:hypothetical protein